MSTIYYYDKLNYYNNNFINIFKAIRIELSKYLSSMFFPNDYVKNDYKRVIYSSIKYAFRKRIELNQKNKIDIEKTYINPNDLQFPFLCYKQTELNPETGRNWWNSPSFMHGIYDETINGKALLLPVDISYEGCLFFDRDDDTFNAYTELLFNDSIETNLYPSINIKNNLGVDTEQQLFLIINFEPTLYPEFGADEADRLEKNKIVTIGINFNIKTFLIKVDYEISIPEEVIIDFVSGMGMDNLSTDTEIVKSLLEE